MKFNLFLTSLAILLATVACNKDPERMVMDAKLKSNLKYDNCSNEAPKSNGAPFSIESAGMHYDHLFLNFSYIGGEKAHDFTVSWDKHIIKKDGKKIVKLDIYHLTDNDKGTNTVYDSLHINLAKLDIPKALFEDENLYFDVVNTTKYGNHVLVQNIPLPEDESPSEPGVQYYVETLTVKETPCQNIGAWTNKWLEKVSNDSTLCYVFEEIDEVNTYTPQLNEKVRVLLQYIPLDDIKGIGDCEYSNTQYVNGIKIKTIEKLN